MEATNNMVETMRKKYNGLLLFDTINYWAEWQKSISIANSA